MAATTTPDLPPAARNQWLHLGCTAAGDAA
jgi:hypothetical protein